MLRSGSIQTPLDQQRLVILRAGQRRQEEEFQDVERQLALDDLDVAQDRFLGIAGKAKDVAGASDGAVGAPLLQHLAIFGDLVLPLLGGDQVVGIDVLQPDEDAARAAPCVAFSMKFGILWQSVSTWMVKPMYMPSSCSLIIRSNSDLPVAVAGEVVVGDEEAVDALRVVLANDRFEIVGRAERGSCGPAR